MSQANIADVGKQFLAEVLQHVPEAQREQVAAGFTPQALEALGQGAARQSDYSRAQDQLAAEKARIDALAKEQANWWEAARPLAELGKAAQDAGWQPGAPPTGAPATLPADVVRKADIEQRERAAVGYFNFITTLGQKHFAEFGEPLDLEALANEATQKGQPLQATYDAKFAERRAAKATEAQNALIETKVQERLAEARKQGLANPYPVSPGMAGSPLDALTPAPGTADVSDLVDEYNQLVSAR